MNEHKKEYEINVGVENKKKYKFFDLSEYLEDNINIYYFVTPRNVGKSTSLWNKVFNDYLNYGHTSAYLRRYDDDIKYFKKSIELLLTKINATYGTQFFYRSRAVWDDDTGNVVCTFHALNTMSKTASTINDDTYNIFFDEVQQHGNQGYLPNEYDIFANLVMHLLRHKRGKIFMFGNTLTIENPYFTAWDFYNDDEKVFQIGRIKVWRFTNADFNLPEITESVAYDLMKHSKKLNEMAVEGKFSYNVRNLIMYKSDAKNQILSLSCVFIILGTNFAVYNLAGDKHWICQLDDLPEGAQTITFSHMDDMMLGENRKRDLSDIFVKLYYWIMNKKLFFNSNTTRSLFLTYIEKGKRIQEERDAARRF